MRWLKQGERLPEEGRSKRKEGILGDFSLRGTMVQSRIDTKQTCGGAMQSSLKRVLDRQGSSVEITRNNRLHTPCHSALRRVDGGVEFHS